LFPDLTSIYEPLLLVIYHNKNNGHLRELSTTSKMLDRDGFSIVLDCNMTGLSASSPHFPPVPSISVLEEMIFISGSKSSFQISISCYFYSIIDSAQHKPVNPFQNKKAYSEISTFCIILKKVLLAACFQAHYTCNCQQRVTSVTLDKPFQTFTVHFQHHAMFFY